VVVRPDFDDLRQRFDEFAARVGEKARPRSGPGRGPSAAPPSGDYWRSVQDLFTRDLSSADLEDLVRDTPDAFRFFTREIDFASLERRPWFRRYPAAGWRVFLALAFRLSPARRVLFALAVPLLALGWAGFGLAILGGGRWEGPQLTVLLAATLLCGLLVFELRDKLALKGDLEIARQIQFGLLPFAPFERDGTVVFSAMRPANTVGGDYFDIIELGAGRVAIAIGDVAGKGIPAALLMALLQGSLRTLITAGLRGPGLVEALNRHLHANIPSNRLITLFYAEYDPSTGELVYVNAGHNAPFLLAPPASAARLPASGMALGIVPEAAYEAHVAGLAPGHRLFLFTDGVTEAFDRGENEYGEERLEALLAAGAALPGAALVEAVRDDVLHFCGPVRPRDDMTLMVVERRPVP
jgi:serine phosphatase RsbU (regulator of sigma subunit)